MVLDGFKQAGFGNNRYTYSGKSSWTSCEYLPMGITEDRETKETYIFQIETSGQWLVEYGSGQGKVLYLALSGATEQEHGWWKNLKPGETFATVPASVGAVKGGLNPAMAAMTRYRRKIRRPNVDDEKLNVVFNDYMNCLEGDPTTERELPMIDRAAELGCEYYCMDCGWYDDGFVCRHGKRHVDNGRYLLDFRKSEVRKYCRDVVDRLIRDYGVEYFKIDYNVTMGYGSDYKSDSCAAAMRDHYECLYRWYEEIFRDYPELVIENCGSGGQRMDYGLLKLLSLQSTSDQTDVTCNANIACNVASAVTPEQGGMWVYPYEDEEEHVIYNMVNGLLLLPYMSGQVWKLGEKSMDLLKEGIALYK